MRTVKIIVVLILCASLCGCKKGESTRNQNAYANKFAKKMKEGKTTREQEQRFILVNADLAYEVDRSTRGTKKADKTRAYALSDQDEPKNGASINLDE